MNDTVIGAIKERLSLGFSKEQILAEFNAAGYPAEVAEEAYRTATSVSQPTTVPEPLIPNVTMRKESPRVVEQIESNWLSFDKDEQEEGHVAETGVATMVTSSAPTLEPAPPPRPPLQHEVINHTAPVATGGSGMKQWALIGVGVVAGVIIIGGATYGVMSGGVGALTGSFFGAKPYATEQEFIAGLATGSNELTAHGFNLDYHLAVEARDEDTLTFDPAVLPEEVREDFNDNIGDMFAMGAVPAEVDVRASFSGVIDARQKGAMEYDISGTINLLAEPIIMNGGGSLRLADGVLYGRIDDIPANFEMYLSGIPKEEWVVINDSESVGLPIDRLPPMPSHEVLKVLPPEVTKLFVSEAKRLATLPLRAVTHSRDFIHSQAAQLGATPFLDTTMNEQEALLMERSVELLKEYPIITFVGEPQKVKRDGETVYEYELDLDPDNLEKYFIALISEGEAIMDEVVPVSETDLRATFGILRPLISEFNRLSTIVYAVRPDGTVAGSRVESLFTFDSPDVKQQFRFALDLSMTRQDDSMDITAPEVVYEKTLEEIMEAQAELFASGECGGNPMCESLLEARSAGNDAAVRQSLSSIRAYAEINYNENDYSYGSVCEDGTIQEILSSMVENNYLSGTIVGAERDGVSGDGKIICNDRSASYAIFVPQVSDFNAAWCIDSTGYFGSVSLDALSSKTDTVCEE